VSALFEQLTNDNASTAIMHSASNFRNFIILSFTLV